MSATLRRRVPAASVALVRIGFGLIVAWEAWRYLDPSHRWVDSYYVNPRFYFGYWPFEWVTPLPTPWIHLVFVAMGICGAAMAMGLFYRFSSSVVALALAYIFLLDKTRYLNHWYLMVLVGILLAVLPVHRYWSLDARRRPAIASSTVPAWVLYLLRFQIGVPYLFGGLAKLNHDWVAARPLYDWISDESDFPLIGPLLDDRGFVLLLAWGALLFDLFVVPALLHPKTRPFAYTAVIAFNLMNDRFFSIGIFPWMMIVASTLFLNPDWPMRMWEAIKRRPGIAVASPIGAALGATFPATPKFLPALVAAIAVPLAVHLYIEAFGPAMERLPVDGGDRMLFDPTSGTDHGHWRRWAVVLVAGWVAVQVLVPFRHFLIPGDVHWTEEGHRFAWHMKLRDKDADAGFFVSLDGQPAFELDEDEWLTSRQERKMSARPDMIVLFAEKLEAAYLEAGHTDVVVTVEAWTRVNGGPEALMIDPTVDLTTLEYPWWPPASWILPRP